MDLGLKGKVALIAGGSSGLGLAIARELAREGAHVAIAGRDSARLRAAASEIETLAAGQVLASPVDIADQAAVHGWIDEVCARLGRPQIAVTNSGGPPFGSASCFDPGEYRAAFDKVFFPAVGLALAVLPHLRAGGWGRLLLITSETVLTPVGRLALSGISRIGLVRFAQSLAAEVAGDGVTVNVLAPGVTHTAGLEKAAARLAGAGGDVAGELARMGRANLLGRPARGEEFGAVAAFLASERASFVTGTVQLVDGGASVMGHDHDYLLAASKDTYTDQP